MFQVKSKYIECGQEVWDNTWLRHEVSESFLEEVVFQQRTEIRISKVRERARLGKTS